MLRTPWSLSLLGRNRRALPKGVARIKSGARSAYRVEREIIGWPVARVRLGLGYANLREQRNLHPQEDIGLLDDPCHPQARPARLVDDEARAEPHVGLVLEVRDSLVRDRDPVAVHAASLRRCAVSIHAPRHLSGLLRGRSAAPRRRWWRGYLALWCAKSVSPANREVQQQTHEGSDCGLSAPQIAAPFHSHKCLQSCAANWARGASTASFGCSHPIICLSSFSIVRGPARVLAPW
jgi:hypothetical protein